MNKLMIYGATGYTGRMAAKHAKALGLDVGIAGRNGERLESLAAQLDVPYRVFTPDDQAAESLEGIGVLLSFAGPFAQTADALIQACIKAGSTIWTSPPRSMSIGWRNGLALRLPRRGSCCYPGSAGMWCSQIA